MSVPASSGPPGPRLAAVLLGAMLLIVLLSVGSTFVFSNLAVQSEFRKLPPEVQTYLRAQQAAARKGQLLAPTPPVPEIRTGTPADPYLPRGQSSPGVYGRVDNPGGPDLLIENGLLRRQPGLRRRWITPPLPQTQDFLHNIQTSLVRIGIISALLSALLAWLLAQRVARPITAVSSAAQQLARGDLSARAPLLGGEKEVTQLALSFNEMAQSLQQMDRERQQAVADIAHELRTPLAVMQARLDALEDGVYPLNAAQIALLSTQTQLLTRLVGDLRTLTLADAGQLELNTRQTDLYELALSVTRSLEQRAAQRSVTLTVRGEVAPLRADPDRLHQVITNLVDNALRHARSRVDISVTPGAHETVLDVDDDGSGIPEGSRELVFTRFSRLDESRARDTGGSGLGLAIVRVLVGAQGGRASAGRSPLGGARFSVVLPVQPAAGLSPAVLSVQDGPESRDRRV